MLKINFIPIWFVFFFFISFINTKKIKNKPVNPKTVPVKKLVYKRVRAIQIYPQTIVLDVGSGIIPRLVNLGMLFVISVRSRAIFK